MASMNNPTDDEEELNKTTTAQSGVIGGSANPEGSQAQGTGWTNLQQYLDGNKGEGGKIADATLQGANDEIKSVGADINTWQADAKKRADEATRKDTYSQKIKSGSDADVAAVDSNEFGAWKNLGNYWGNSDATQDAGYGDVYSKSKAAQGTIDNANTWEGQQGLAKKTFGKDAPNYTDGMGLLDTFVARQDAPGKFDSFAADNKAFGNKITDAAAGFNAYAAGGEGRGQAVLDGTSSAIKNRQADLAKIAQTRGGAEQDRQFASQEARIKKMFTDAGGAAPDSVLDYLTPNSEFNGNTFYSKVEEDALNKLAGIDDDASTNNLVRGSQTAYRQTETPAIDSGIVKRDMNGNVIQNSNAMPESRLQRDIRLAKEAGAVNTKAAADFATSGGFAGGQIAAAKAAAAAQLKAEQDQEARDRANGRLPQNRTITR